MHATRLILRVAALTLVTLVLGSTAAIAQSPHEPAVGATIEGLTLPAMKTQAPDDPQPVIGSTLTSGNTNTSTGVDIPLPPTQQTLVLIPGVNQVIPIARGHLNRIITPFSDPVVHTTSTAKISTEANVLYVASTARSPTTLYVSPRGSQQTALSLTLLPRPIPPREIRIRIAEQAGTGYTNYSNRYAAGQWERERPYVQTIKKALRKLALGEVPPGFGMHHWRAGDPLIACAQATLAVEQGQVLPGSQVVLLVGKATNITSARVLINEARCRQEGVMAVAAWPRVSLAPGQSAELYVVVRRPDPAEKARQRPSLLGGGDS